MPLRIDAAGTFLARFEQRWAQAPRPLREDGVRGTGRTRVWARMTATPARSTARCWRCSPTWRRRRSARRSASRPAGCRWTTPSATRAPGRPSPAGWVLVDLTCEAVVGDVAQLSGRLFDPAGTLLAVCEQSAVVRRRPVPRTRA